MSLRRSVASSGTLPLRLMFYDNTCGGPGPLPGLTASWYVGGALYKALGRLDAYRGFATWAAAVEWLAAYEPTRPIGEVQFWGHGRWGGLYIAEDVLEIDVLSPNHPIFPHLVNIRRRMLPDAASLWWFRTCDTFGTQVGHQFAREWTKFFECSAAGHTYNILFWQSGLHLLRPGQEPDWPIDEGVVPGLAHGQHSHRRAPLTISCLHNDKRWS